MLGIKIFALILLILSVIALTRAKKPGLWTAPIIFLYAVGIALIIGIDPGA